ncbi:MAG: protease modulator HflC [Gammaproteobacteria bacterium]|nr:protease modulator HflC [Gammaproteobacteria bacterium]
MKKFLLIIIVVAALLLLACLFSVKEGQAALVLRLGKIVRAPSGEVIVMHPGLHFRIPVINKVRKFDVRLQTLDAQSSRVLTKEQKYVLVDYYVKWRIADLPLYYTRTGGFTDRTETLLQQKVNDALRAAFGKRTITDVVSGERGNVMTILKQRADASAKGLGVEVIDVRIKRIDLPEEVSASVFDRMRVEREQAATRHRSDGKAQAERVRAKADATVTVTIAEAKAKAAKIKAAGDGKAARIYADAYNKDANFYELYQSLKAYQDVFRNKHDVLLLKPDSQFFKYFNSAGK